VNAEERQMYDFAYTLVESAGVKLKLKRMNSVLEYVEKTSHNDLVTEHDLFIEKYLTDLIISKYPNHGILSEEGNCNKSSSASEYIWIIDPIDGTTNYFRFGKDYAISLALYCLEKPVFGLVYDVSNSLMFSGKHDEGAIVNGCKPISLPGLVDLLSKSVVAISLRTMKEFESHGMDVLGMLSKAQAHRYLGCASLEICRVANGEYDLFISSNVHEWDIAAARVYLEQRGGFLISKKKDINGGAGGKLMVVAFRSPKIWEEAIHHLPVKIKNVFGY
jgi:myo-inositol-1(or 4)-monophosphatase